LAIYIKLSQAADNTEVCVNVSWAKSCSSCRSEKVGRKEGFDEDFERTAATKDGLSRKKQEGLPPCLHCDSKVGFLFMGWNQQNAITSL
jgi:hypothetical protein